ncbi:hypothetical protein DSO57_1025799, partial [Entomophthora muscae]
TLHHGWFKYPSGHWERKFHYGCSSTPLPTEPSLVRPYASFYLLTYVVGYYLLGRFSSMMGRFAYLGHLGHLAMITVPIGSVIAGLNLGTLVHQVGKLFPIKWIPDTSLLASNPHIGFRDPSRLGSLSVNAYWSPGCGPRCLLPSLFSAGLLWEAPLSGYPSLALDGILVVGPTRMGARLC